MYSYLEIRRRRRLHAIYNQPELIAAQAGQRIAVAKRRREPPGQLLQEAVAHLVPQRVVDMLELIDVQEQHADHVPLAVRSAEYGIQVFQ